MLYYDALQLIGQSRDASGHVLSTGKTAPEEFYYPVDTFC